MNEQIKELIAVGASVAAHCQPCLKYHYAKARELGIEVTDINAAIDVGHQVSRGAVQAMHDYRETLIAGSHAASPSDGCCCGNKAEGSGEGKCC